MPHGPLEQVADWMSSGTIVAFNFLQNNPRFSGAIAITLGVAYVGVQIVRGVWPDRATRPSWARAVVAVGGPVAAVLIALFGRLAWLAGSRKAERLRAEEGSDFGPRRSGRGGGGRRRVV